MSPQSPEREELPARDRRWVEALRARAPDGPPPALDAVVLAAARTAVGAKAVAPSGPSGRGGGAPRWLAAVAGVMVVLSAGVLVRQVALETAPKVEPEFPVSPAVVAPGRQSAAGERADTVLQATREAEDLPAWETVESEAPTEAGLADAAAAPGPDPEPAPMTAQAEAERAMRAQTMEAAPMAPPPPAESPVLLQMGPAPEPMAPPAPPASAPPAADFAPSPARPLAESASAPAAFGAASPAPAVAAKSAPAERSEQAEAGLASAAAEPEAGLPEPEVLAEVRRLLAAGNRDAARELLAEWRTRHPAPELPAALQDLLDAPMREGS